MWRQTYNYVCFCIFCIGFAEKMLNQIKCTCYAQSNHIHQVLFSSRQRHSFASSGVCCKKVSHCVWTTETFSIDERGYTRSNGVDLYMCFGVWFSFSPTLADGDDDEYMCCWQKWAVDGYSLLKSAFGNQSVVSVLCLPGKNAAESLLCVYWHWMLKSSVFAVQDDLWV